MIDDNGSTSQRSMVYSEYFVRGTEPTDTCPLHVGRSLFAKMGDWFTGSPSAPPSRVRTGEAEATVAAAPENAETATAETTEEKVEKPKKRGFWSRLFGRGGDDDKKKNEKKEKEKKKPSRRPPGGEQ